MNEENKLTVEELHVIIAQPFYAVNIHPSLSGEHEPLISTETWVQAQKRLLKEVGEDKYFEILLQSLTNPVLNDEAVDGYKAYEK